MMEKMQFVAKVLCALLTTLGMSNLAAAQGRAKPKQIIERGGCVTLARQAQTWTMTTNCGGDRVRVVVSGPTWRLSGAGLSVHGGGGADNAFATKPKFSKDPWRDLAGTPEGERVARELRDALRDAGEHKLFLSARFIAPMLAMLGEPPNASDLPGNPPVTGRVSTTGMCIIDCREEADKALLMCLVDCANDRECRNMCWREYWATLRTCLENSEPCPR